MATKKVKGQKVSLSEFAAPNPLDARANLPSAPDPSREYVILSFYVQSSFL